MTDPAHVKDPEHLLYLRPARGTPGLIDPPGSYAELPSTAADPFAPDVAPPPSGIPARLPEPARDDRSDWPYAEDDRIGTGADLVGFRVEALDGRIGRIDPVSPSLGGSFLVVSTGPWVFGRKLLLPVGTITRIDSLDRAVYVDRTKGQITDSPEFDQHSA